MKNLTIKLAFAAAALAAVAGTAAAETLKADIPFAFRSGNKVMNGGSYVISAEPGNHVIRFLNVTGHDGMLVMPQSAQDPPKSWQDEGTPRLMFECGGDRCVLVQIWSGGSSAYSFARPKPGTYESARTVLVPLKTVKAD